MKRSKISAIFLGLLASGPLSVKAGQIVYDAATNRIYVAGYPEEQPATLDAVWAADQKGGWGRVTYDKSTDTFTLKAALWIGAQTDWGTFFQIGRPDHPRETLVLHGDLVVTPPRPSGQRGADGRRWIANRLTLGDPTNATLRALVKIACSRKDEFGVKVQVAPEPKAQADRERWPVGEWFMFNSVLTAATPDSNHTYTAAICLSHAGVNYAMRNSAISWWSGSLFQTVWLPVHWRTSQNAEGKTLRGMTLENGGSAVGPFECVDCVFRNLDEARRYNGGTRCRFENNGINFTMPNDHTGVMFTDCNFGQARKPLQLPRSTRDELWLRRHSVYRKVDNRELVLNPGVVERISVPVRVTDQRGQPVVGAAVMIECPEDRDDVAVWRQLAVTDEKGLTPADAEGRALVITKRILQPGADPLRPKEINYVYQLRVQAPGYTEHRELIQPSAAPLPRPYPVKLKRI